MGLWCSGITFDLHSKGLGFDPRWIHLLLFLHISFLFLLINVKIKEKHIQLIKKLIKNVFLSFFFIQSIKSQWETSIYTHLLIYLYKSLIDIIFIFLKSIFKTICSLFQSLTIPLNSLINSST